MELEKYFQSFEDYFWEFDTRLSSDNGGEVISIPNAFTIAYEEFIFEILEFLCEDSFPPLGSLLLAIIGTNQENEGSIEMINYIAQEKIKLNKASYVNPEGDFFRVGAVIDFLKILASLPEDYKRGEKRLQLFQTIFHDCHKRVSSDKAKKILDEYHDNKKNGIKFQNKRPFNLGNFIKDFRTIALLKVKFPTVQSILNAMADVPQQDLNDKLEEEIFEEKNVSETPDFVEQLIENDNTFQVGSLIRRLWSGLHIPLHHNHPSEQPMGGISDLANKGDFDKLVISEFAYDDDVFMSRIANNEALFVQREVPPEADKFERILLIDVSLMNWGNPKILSYASAIAIARHPKTDIKCRIFAVGQDFKLVSLENVYDVINALGELSTKLDCSIGIDSFFQQNKISIKNQEVFLFSSEESLKLAPMQKVLNEYFSEIKYVFEMEMENFKIYKNQNKGRKMLQHIIMPLEELWAKEKADSQRKMEKTALDGIPLLYPVERNYQNIFHDGNDYYMYINRNLFLFVSTNFNKGFKKIASNLPFGDGGTFSIKINSRGQKLFLYFPYDCEQNVSVMNLDTQELKNGILSYNELSGTKITAFEFSGEFYLTDGISSYWHIDDNIKIKNTDSEVVKDAFLNYAGKRTSFTDNFMKSKFKYSTIKRLKGFSIVNNHIQINGFNFVHLEFSKQHYYYGDVSGDVTIRFDEKVNLILKNRGESFIDIVKVIKENTGQSLAESKKIVDDELGVVLYNVTKEKAEELKKIIENNGAVCYIETLFFESKDGSKVSNKDGILIFESSKEEIAKFYIPFIIDGRTIMASESEYSGNDYFISDSVMESIKEKEFIEKYIEPFIHNIKQHGT